MSSFLCELLKCVEMDPTQQKDWVKNAMFAGTGTALELFKAASRAQNNDFDKVKISENQFVFAMAPPQTGKTRGIMGSLLEAAFDNQMPGVLMCMNSKTETERFCSSAEGFNALVRDCASCEGSSSSSPPRLELFDASRSAKYRKALEAWSSGASSTIPIFVAMANPAKFKQFKANILPAVAKACGRDSQGRLRAYMVVDEADLLYKSGDYTSSLEREAFAQPVQIGTEEFENLHGAFSSVMYVSATPQAMVSNPMPISGRDVVVVEQSPSSNSWQFHRQDGWKCNLITRTEAESPREMVESMLEAPESRAALVSSVSKSFVKQRVADALSIAEEFKASPGLVTFSWSAGVIVAHTSDPLWASVLDAAPVGTLQKKASSTGVRTYTGKKSVNSYPRMISFLMKGFPDAKPLYKFVLYAKKMADRGVPVKGDNHECSLTDMYIRAAGMHAEALIQVCGRLCGVDATATSKTLWANITQHKVHVNAIDRVVYMIEKMLKKGMNALEAMEATRKTILDLTSDDDTVKEVDEVEDVLGALCATKGKLCRIEARRRLMGGRDLLKSTATMKKVKISGVDIETGITHSAVPVEVLDVDDDEDDAEDVAPVVVSDFSKFETMMEFAQNHGVQISRCIKDAVAESGSNQGELRHLALSMSAHAEYPDGASFSPTEFLSFVAVHSKRIVSDAGIVVEAGVYRVVCVV